MFSKILVATDLSKASDQLVGCIHELKSLGARHVVLAFCLYLQDVRNLADNIRELFHPALEKQQKILHNQGFKTTIEIALGSPKVEINRLAVKNKCSLIVVGSSGHDTITGEMIFGGIACEIMHGAAKPVLIVRLNSKKQTKVPICRTWPCKPLHTVLFPTDFSDNAEHAFTILENLVESGMKRIILLHVQDKTKIGKYLEDRLEQFNAIDRERLERLKGILLKKGVSEVRIEIPYGHPVSEILKRTRKTEVSLVVMGSQGRGFIKEIFLGSVSHNITRQAPVPVLLIPAVR
jgi:nucleotide-binding universal stress UspA family protein